MVPVHCYMFWWLTFTIRKVKEKVQVNVKFSLTCHEGTDQGATPIFTAS